MPTTRTITGPVLDLRGDPVTQEFWIVSTPAAVQGENTFLGSRKKVSPDEDGQFSIELVVSEDFDTPQTYLA